jgi:adenylate kinase
LVDKQVNIILFGPPGAGKGTQANNLAKSFNLNKISTGDLLRIEIKNKTKIGLENKSIVEKGSLVSDIVINSLIEKVFSNKDFSNRLIFDGYPRNLYQAKNLDLIVKKYKQKISCVLNLNVDKDIIVKRILGRELCSKCGLIFNKSFKPSSQQNHACGDEFLIKRSDDNEEVILYRYQTYLEKTAPILDYYKKQNLLHEINGKAEIDQIYEEICTILSSLVT